MTPEERYYVRRQAEQGLAIPAGTVRQLLDECDQLAARLHEARGLLRHAESHWACMAFSKWTWAVQEFLRV